MSTNRAMSEIAGYSSKKKRKISNDHEVEDSLLSGLRRWENLDIDILKQIFRHVSSRHLSRNVSLVCRSWKLALRDLLFWSRNKLDLSASMLGVGSRTKTFKSHKYHLYRSPYKQFYQCTPLDMKLMTLFKSIMEGNDAYGYPLEHWRQSIRTVFVPISHNLSDDHLIYIAERTSGLEWLQLLGSLRVTGRGFAKAMSSWKNLNCLCLGQVFSKCFEEIINAIGKNSPGLTTLLLSDHRLSISSGRAIIENLPQVRTLKFDASYMYRFGMEIILNQYHELKEIQFYRCYLWGYQGSLFFKDQTYQSFVVRFRRMDNGDRKWSIEVINDGADEPNVLLQLHSRFLHWMNEVNVQMPLGVD